MRFFTFVAIFFGSLCAHAKQLNLNYFGHSHTYTNGWFGSTDPRQPANDSQPGELAVHRLLLPNGWCSAVMIAPQWAVTAAHCVKDNPFAIRFYRDNEPGPTVGVDRSWYGKYYGKFLTMDSVQFLYQDFGTVHLQSPAPKWVTFAEIARPNEVYVGEPAKTVGFPFDSFGGDIKVSAGNCGVRDLLGDAILSDCAISEGSSGGALFVYTRLGKWKLGGVTSTEFGYNSNGQEHTIQGGPYSNAVGNRFVNITYYSGRIANTVASFDGEKLPTLRASLTYPVQCLTQFTSINWKTIRDNGINACKEVQTQSQLNCVLKLFQNSQASNSQNYQSCFGKKGTSIGTRRLYVE